MKFDRRGLCTAIFGVSAICGADTAMAAGDIDDLLVDGKFTFDGRARYEEVDQEGFGEHAKAPTVRARVGFVTGKFADFQGLIEAETVGHLSERFNDTVNGNTSFPIVADPTTFELNRLQVEYTGIPKTVVTLGRQRINLDNQRFVGAVGWRQNEQTFDAFRITNTSIDGLTLNYMFVNQVNRVFGNESLQGEFEGPTHLVNVGYDLAPIGKIVGYAYLVDIDLASMKNQSTATYGLRVTGKKDLGDGYGLGYEGEYAHQNDYADNPADLSLDYWHGDLWLTQSGFTLLAGVESLEGNGSLGFSTPLATLHKFQGYADVFLTTPGNGIVDVYGKLAYEKKLDEPFGPITGVTAAAWYHGYDTERTDQSIGEEFNFEAAAKLGDHFAIGTKYANFNNDTGFPQYADRHKVWFYIDAIY